LHHKHVNDFNEREKTETRKQTQHSSHIRQNIDVGELLLALRDEDFGFLEVEGELSDIGVPLRKFIFFARKDWFRQ
jgi:hypothetical protein